MKCRPLTTTLLTLLLVPTSLLSVLAAQEPETMGFAYTDWSRVLESVVDERGLVDYAALAKDRAGLDRVIAGIESVSPRSHPERFEGREAELAYYINAYNALVFDGVLAKGPEIGSVWGRTGTGLGFFVGSKFTVGGEKISLKKFEDQRVRAGFRDPRIHAALNCASLGCPRLPQTPFSPTNLDAELDAAMAEFVSSERNVRVDPQRQAVTLSRIFEWFRKDFVEFELDQGTAKPNLIDYVNRFRQVESAIPRHFRIEFAKYDKRLNGQS